MGYRSDEQETVISYDHQTGKRRVYSTYGPHARMFEKAVKDGSRKERTDNGTLIMIDGELSEEFRISIHKVRKMTDEQRQQASERLKAIRARKEGGAVNGSD